VADRLKIRRRQIRPDDLEAIINLLVRGFPVRSREYWRRGLDRHAERPLAPGLPQFGYLLERDGKPIGVLLVLATPAEIGGTNTTRCDFSSWYVEPEFRSFAPLLMSAAMRLADVTYVNISAAKHTWPIIEAFGFLPYCVGLFTAFPFLAPPARGILLTEVKPGTPSQAHLPAREYDLLVAHAGYGWLSMICSAPDGDHPFIFQPFRRWRRRLPGMRLIYCRDLSDFVRFAGPLGRYLLRRGVPWLAIDANGPIDGLVGFYQRPPSRRYFKGPDRPRLGDLTYTEVALFGP
jgi:hypothetical protein